MTVWFRVYFISRNMIRKKYKFVNDVKISEFNAANASIVLKNEKTEKNAMTKNQKFEQIEQTTIVQNKEKAFFNSVSNNITSRKNFIRICRFIHSIDIQVNFTFHFTRSTFNINILENIFHIYQQLLHARFFNIFAQFALVEVIEKFDCSELNELKWQYQSFLFQNEVSSKKGFIFIFNSSNFCQLFDLRVKTRSSLFISISFFQNSSSIISISSIKSEV